jgi:branched-chain amino acid transport system substrate-binding protein
MCPKRSLWYKFIALALALVLIVPILAACGKEKEKTPTPTPPPTATSGPTPTATPGPTPTPTPAKGPVKIGVIMPWSGPLAMSGLLVDQVIAVIQDQLKNQGGILGGREVEFVRGDDRGMVAESVGQARKLALEEKVDILTLGGVSAASFTAVADVAEEVKVPYVAFATIFGVADMKYCAACFCNEPFIARIANFLIDVVKPKTVAWLAYDLEDTRDMIDGVEDVPGFRERIEAEGIDVVYEQYFPLDTVDFSPYLTKIKYVNPDILLSCLNGAGQAITINKQIMELGGWGSMKYFCTSEQGTNKTAINMPAAVGTYTAVLWLPGSDEPGMKAFEDAYTQHFGHLPDPALTYFYNSIWTAIKAIEMAGTTDHDKVAEALRSGNLEWVSAWGHLRIGTDGKGVPTMMVAQIQEGGELVKVWPQ